MHSRKLKPPTKTQILIAFWNFQKIVDKLLLYLISVDFWNQIFKNSREYGNFENSVTQTPTWHEILKPIRMLVTIFISYISRYIHNLYTYKVWRKLKDKKDDRPTRPIKLKPPTKTQILTGFWNFKKIIHKLFLNLISVNFLNQILRNSRI